MPAEQVLTIQAKDRADEASTREQPRACLKTARDHAHCYGNRGNFPISQLEEEDLKPEHLPERDHFKPKEIDILLIGSFKVHICFPAYPRAEGS